MANIIDDILHAITQVVNQLQVININIEQALAFMQEDEPEPEPEPEPPPITVRPTWDEIKDYIESDNIVDGGTISINGEYESTSTIRFPEDRKVIIEGKDAIINLIEPAFFLQSNDRATGIEYRTTKHRNALLANGRDWRIDNSKYNNLDYTHQGVFVYASSGYYNNQKCRGLIDSCKVESGKVLPLGYGIPTSLMAQARAWAEPTALGSRDAVYIEDCHFSIGPWDDPINDPGNCLDVNYGGRYVVRFCLVLQSYFEVHSLQLDNSRGGRAWEIYHNIISSFGNQSWAGCSIRGGTGVIFNNDFTPVGAPYNINIKFDNVRSFKANKTRSGNHKVCGQCDGTSDVDGNLYNTGWWCRDQIGRGQDDYLWEFWDKNKPIPYQAHEPAYVWGNTDDGQSVFPHVRPNSEQHIQTGRDYFNALSGPELQMPISAPEGAGYWVTDKGVWNKAIDEPGGQLYVFKNNNWQLYYEPLQYPHPLRNE